MAKFHNTLIDFEECAYELLVQAFNPEKTEPLSREELRSAFELLDSIVGLLENFYFDIDHTRVELVKALIRENQK